MKRWKTVSAFAAAALVFGTAWTFQNSVAADRRGEWIPARRGDLVLGIEVAGTLAAIDTTSLGPPQVEDTWDYKISMMAPEGSEVKQGRPVLGFDTSELQRKLEGKVAERDSAAKEIEKKRADLRLKNEEEELQLAIAESNLRKAKLKLDSPEELNSVKERKQASLDFQIATRETNDLKTRLRELRRAAEAELMLLESRRARAAAAVAQLETAIQKMTITAPRDGTVIYATNWRGDKKKVGDSAWRAEKIMEIPDLNRMMATGEVDETDAGRVELGQKVVLELDAHADEEFTGTITKLAKTVQPQSPRNPVKVLKVEITLDRTDREKMRPGMRFRGTVELQRVKQAVLVPKRAVSTTGEDAVVWRRGLFSMYPQKVKIGRYNAEQIEIVEGIAAGDRILIEKQTEDPEKKS